MLTVGRVAFEKNISFLISMLERLRLAIPDVLLVIAGEGPALAALRRDVEAAGSPGTYASSATSTARGSSSIATEARTPSCSRRVRRRRPRAAEAMALGVPVVSTAIMGTRFVLDGPAARSSSRRTRSSSPQRSRSCFAIPASGQARRRSLGICRIALVEPSHGERLLGFYSGVAARAPAREPIHASAA
jgi:hypothetical protein